MLPKQTLPIFELTVPSTNKRITYRQFTVREEKMMLQAQESDDIALISSCIKEIIKACSPDIGDVNKLALFDVEYILTKIRSKSVGEYIDLAMECDANPNHRKTPVRINLETIRVNISPEHSKNIPLYDDVGIIMRYPTVDDLATFDGLTEEQAAAACIESIYTKDEIFAREDQTPEEIAEFLDGLTTEQFEKIKTMFFKTMPVFEYDFEYTCPDCGHYHHKYVKGLSNFFV